MLKSIRWRLVVIFVLLATIVIIASGTLIVFQTREYEYNLIKNDLKKTVDSIRNIIITNQSNEAIEEDIKYLLSHSSSLYNKNAFLLDAKGNILYSNNIVIGALTQQNFYTAQVMGALNNNLTDEFDEKQESLGYATNVVKQDQVQYVIYVQSPTTQVQEKVYSTVMIIVLAIAVAIILAIILAFLFSSYLTKPISALTVKAREMATGELNNPIEVFSNDEIGDLTENFNKMAISLNKTLAEIAGEKNKMETVFTHMTDGILVFDSAGNIIHKNPAAFKMLKTRKAKNFNQVFANKVEWSYQELLRAVRNRPKRITVTIDNFFYSVDFARYINEQEKALGLISVIQDITEHKKLENLQKEFVANVSHEIRTPLTTIKSYTETLLEGEIEDRATITRFLTVINDESDRMALLVQDLLELSKLDNKKAVTDYQLIEMNELVAQCVNNFRIHAQKKEQILSFAGCDQDCYIMGEQKRIEQVFNNLLSNAIKYSDVGDRIALVCYEVDYYIVVEISDTGMGMPKSDLEHIFERFYRVDKARSRSMGGTGLGLAIAKEIVELHEGKIKVDSQLEVGTTFTVYLPKYEDKDLI